MKRNKKFLGLAILFFVFAVVFSILFWSGVSLAAQVGHFVLGFGSGTMATRWYFQRDVG